MKMQTVIDIYNQLFDAYKELKDSFLEQEKLKEDEIDNLENIIEERKDKMNKINKLTDYLHAEKEQAARQLEIDEFNFSSIEGKVSPKELGQLKAVSNDIKELLKEIMELNQTITSDYETKIKGSQQKLKTVKQGKKLHKAYAQAQQHAYFLDKKS
ncbi:hypothetical protein PRVXH_000497 [Proteinivorax hydrogeniformans]|uniref:FlgN protein n=1 Tax=Proteinivorax hydrogeniformans TaxID=1826727 RepID=A0AAU8HUZ3_9FIRM